MKPLKDFFHYTRSERNGALILLLLCVILMVAPRLFVLFSSSERISFDEEMRLAEQLAQSSGEENGTPGTPVQLFEFDPNTATQEELQRLGLRERTVKSIVNYRSKGGQFRKKEDLKKIYTLAEEDYFRLEPYIRIASNDSYSNYNSYDKKEPKTYTLVAFDPNTATQEELLNLGLPKGVVTVMLRFREKGGKYRRKEDLKKIYILDEADYLRIEPYISIAGDGASIPTVALDIPQSYENERNISIDINKASAEEWQQLRGVGPAFSGKITRFREALGGFTSIEQVAETRGLPDSTFQKIRSQLRPSPVFRLIDINAAPADVLSKHPYIDRRMAEAIVSYRQQHGAFRSADDLRKVYALPEGWVEKMKPYLDFGK